MAKPKFDHEILVLQGGGALGAYQAGVYEGIAAAGPRPDLGRRRLDRRDQRRADRRQPARTPGRAAARVLGPRVRACARAWPAGSTRAADDQPLSAGSRRRCSASRVSSRRGCRRRSCAGRQRPSAASFYDTAPLRAPSTSWSTSTASIAATVRLRSARSTSAPATRSTSTARRTRIGPEHVMASGALPPGLSAGGDRRRVLLGRRDRVQHAAAVRRGRDFRMTTR